MIAIGEGIWIYERPFCLFGAEFGNRMTIVRLHSGDILVHSPVALDETLKYQIESIGRIAFIVTPNAFHGLFIAEWMNAFPDARHLTAKSTQQGHGYSSETLSESRIAELSPTLEVVLVNGLPKVNEFAFFHKSSHTLILTDLAFNIGKDVSLWTKLFFSLNSAYGRFGPSRLMRSMIEDRNAFRASLLKIFEWDFEQVVISHGSIVKSGGKETMNRAFQQYLTTSPTRHRTISPRPPMRCG